MQRGDIVCGIVGWKKWNPALKELQQLNAKRGGYSTGALIELSGVRREKGTFYLDGADNSIIQFRAPTTESKEWKEEENYPLEYEGWYMFGNAVLSASWYQQVKDEEICNDIYYVLKGVAREGFDYLQTVKGCFAFVIVSPDKKIYLVRNTYPLYYTDNVFSSVKFVDAKLLENGALYDWSSGRVVRRYSFYNPYEF